MPGSLNSMPVGSVRDLELGSVSVFQRLPLWRDAVALQVTIEVAILPNRWFGIFPMPDSPRNVYAFLDIAPTHLGRVTVNEVQRALRTYGGNEAAPSGQNRECTNYDRDGGND
jgi:hypothetical protein